MHSYKCGDKLYFVHGNTDGLFEDCDDQDLLAIFDLDCTYSEYQKNGYLHREDRLPAGIVWYDAQI